jgi:antitoxin (DNA-binding transcriptional repressor) of toxin-antitoxin stability system
MKTTTKSLHTHTKRIRDAVKRGQKVVINVRNKPRARITTLKSDRHFKRKTPLFGIWKDHSDSHDVSAYLDSIRGTR